jgi:hypothetical protein
VEFEGFEFNLEYLGSKSLFIIGLFLLIAGIAMFVWAVHVFTYRGDYIELMRTTGEYSMVFWLPTSIIGLILTIIGLIKR